ncbi:hypothetical protein RvY_03693-2 [Ramazzottius varieornatus]|uniref:Nuclear receptor domain-containing protein n=1 Tax=Ramazzottius varieornatus TaxID=947166 RepID=A0A1D1UYC5_RAMVA|nr:hypothetical protein RvY_03693-2 [Ramazzottius varieornatus]
MDRGSFGSACPDTGAFYRRSLRNSTTYRCYLGGKCTVGPRSKGRCRPCRFAKCVKVGMKLDGKVMGRTPLWKRNVQRAIADILPEPVSTGPQTGQTPQMTEEKTSSDSVRRKAVAGGAVVGEALQDARLLRITSTASYSTPHSPLLKIVVPDKSSKMSLDESFGEVDKREMLWQAYAKGQLDLSAVMKQTTVIDVTISAVAAAIQSVYAADLATWKAEMHDMLVNGNVPFQPQVSLAAYKENSAIALVEAVRQHCQFSMMLPGLSTFDEQSQQALLREKWPEDWLVTRRNLVRGGNLYYLNGPLRVHASVYWLQQTHQREVIASLLDLANAMNSLKLSHLEAFLVYAVSMFAPEATSVEDKPRLAILQCHYRDCLLHVVRSNASLDGEVKGEQRPGDREWSILHFADEVLRSFGPPVHRYVKRQDQTTEVGGK